MEELIQLLRSRIDAGEAITAQTPLIRSGLVDSFAMADLLAELERHFRIEIRLADVGVDNFDTPALILKFIQARRACNPTI